MKRMFVAIDLPDGLKEEISRCAGFKDKGYRGISWVKPENMHITLNFLGDTEENALNQIRSALDAASAAKTKFTVVYSGIGRFGRGGSTSTIWVGAHESTGRLSGLASAIDDALMPLGYVKEDKPFFPHVTICRVKEGSNLPPWDLIKGDFKKVDSRVLHEGFSLYESVLTREGPIYVRDSWFPLKRD